MALNEIQNLDTKLYTTTSRVLCSQHYGSPVTPVTVDDMVTCDYVLILVSVLTSLVPSVNRVVAKEPSG